jgi:hypothetical protein
VEISDFLSGYLFELSYQLESSNTHLTIFAAILGAFLGVFLTVTIGFISNRIRVISYNRIARNQLRDFAELNMTRCQANVGVLNNEIANLKPHGGKITLNGLSNLVDYPLSLLHSPASFRSSELFLLRMQISALNSHHSQLVNVVTIRENLSVEIRKAPVGSQESEVSGLRLEYDQLLLKKYKDIISFTNALNDYLNIYPVKRFILNFIRVTKLEEMARFS